MVRSATSEEFRVLPDESSTGVPGEVANEGYAQSGADEQSNERAEVRSTEFTEGLSA